MISNGPAPRRVLVVDDCKDSVTILKLQLKRFGSEVHAAYDGPEAIKLAEELQPEVVLLDITLPSMSGYDVARRIREQTWARNILIVAVTGWDLDKERTTVLDAGFNSHLLKPVGFAALERLFTELSVPAI